MKVQFVNLQRQNKIYHNEYVKIVEKIIKNADFNMGPTLKEFEDSFASFCGKKFAVGVNSGTDALQLSLMAYGIGAGDEVIVPANSYFASAMVVNNVGAVPVFIDIDPVTYMIDETQLTSKLSKKTKAIIPVHMYGQSANMDPILNFAKKNKLIVIEDACQSHGAMYKNRRVPYGETGAFSFYPGKNLGCFGDGGAVVTDNKEIAQRILYLRNDGSYEKYEHRMFGMKSRLDTIEAAILQLKLKHLPKWNELRRQHADLYRHYLSDVSEITLPNEKEDNYHVYHLFVIEYKKRNQLQTYLLEKGIQTIIHYPTPIHLQKPYQDIGHKKGDYPITEKKAEKILSLPMFPEMKKNEIQYVCRSIKDFMKS